MEDVENDQLNVLKNVVGPRVDETLTEDATLCKTEIDYSGGI